MSSPASARTRGGGAAPAPPQGFFGRMVSAGVRMVTGESLFMTHFTHQGHGKSHVGFAAPYPGSVVAVDMAGVGGELVCQKDSFLCAALGTKVSVTFNRRLGAGLFGGEGFVLQKLEGDGMAFLHAGGTVVRRELRGQTYAYMEDPRVQDVTSGPNPQYKVPKGVPAGGITITVRGENLQYVREPRMAVQLEGAEYRSVSI